MRRLYLDIVRSAGQVSREISELAWIGDDEDLTGERHRELIAKGASWVPVDHEDRPFAFLSAEIQDGELHIWEFSVSHPYSVSRCDLEQAVLELGFQTLDNKETGERLRGLLRREVERGLPESQRCAMRLVLR